MDNLIKQTIEALGDFNTSFIEQLRDNVVKWEDDIQNFYILLKPIYLQRYFVLDTKLEKLIVDNALILARLYNGGTLPLCVDESHEDIKMDFYKKTGFPLDKEEKYYEITLTSLKEEYKISSLSSELRNAPKLVFNKKNGLERYKNNVIKK